MLVILYLPIRTYNIIYIIVVTIAIVLTIASIVICSTIKDSSPSFVKILLGFCKATYSIYYKELASEYTIFILLLFKDFIYL